MSLPSNTGEGVLQQFTARFQGLTRLLHLPPFASFTPDEQTRMVLGNPPPQVLQKGLKGWIMEATPICIEFAHALRMHVTSLLPAVVDMSSDDEAALSSDNNDDFSPILLPPGFQPALTPPNDTMLVPFDDVISIWRFYLPGVEPGISRWLVGISTARP